MTQANLATYTTKDLVEELVRRQAVTHTSIEPYQTYEIRVGETLTSETGPAIILVVVD